LKYNATLGDDATKSLWLAAPILKLRKLLLESRPTLAEWAGDGNDAIAGPTVLNHVAISAKRNYTPSIWGLKDGKPLTTLLT
jgi:hypothetical protein